MPAPRVQGQVTVRDHRVLSFAEFGTPRGEPVLWMHGTPGGRRQVPVGARRFARRQGLRVIGLDRPGVGQSTAHRYRDLVDWVADLRIVLDALGVERAHLVGLSGGGPFCLAAAAVAPDRVASVSVIGGVVPTMGPDGIGGGAVGLARLLAPALLVVERPLSTGFSSLIRALRPLGGPVLDAYAAWQPYGDRTLLRDPEFRAMFLDDLVGQSKDQMSAPVLDLLLFSKPWGFALAEVLVPVRWWHGEQDHIVPMHHAEHAISRLPRATLTRLPGANHLGGLAAAERLLAELVGSDWQSATT